MKPKMPRGCRTRPAAMPTAGATEAAVAAAAAEAAEAEVAAAPPSLTAVFASAKSGITGAVKGQMRRIARSCPRSDRRSCTAALVEMHAARTPPRRVDARAEEAVPRTTPPKTRRSVELRRLSAASRRKMAGAAEEGEGDVAREVEAGRRWRRVVDGGEVRRKAERRGHRRRKSRGCPSRMRSVAIGTVSAARLGSGSRDWQSRYTAIGVIAADRGEGEMACGWWRASRGGTPAILDRPRRRRPPSAPR